MIHMVPTCMRFCLCGTKKKTLKKIVHIEKDMGSNDVWTLMFSKTSLFVSPQKK